jgi:hypothetical protein
MAGKVISFRSSEPETSERVDRLVERMSASREYRGLNITRGAVLNMALLRGLDRLDELFPPEPKRSKGNRGR